MWTDRKLRMALANGAVSLGLLLGAGAAQATPTVIRDGATALGILNLEVPGFAQPFNVVFRFDSADTVYGSDPATREIGHYSRWVKSDPRFSTAEPGPELLAGLLAFGAEQSHLPVPFSVLDEFVEIAPGYWHTCARDDSGEVFCWGSSLDAAIANKDPQKPTRVAITAEIDTITIGATVACALLTSGGMKCWGANYYGELGDGSTKQRDRPVDVVGTVDPADQSLADLVLE